MPMNSRTDRIPTYGNESEQAANISNDVDKPHKHNAEQKKPDTHSKRFHLYEVLNWAKLIYSKGSQTSGCQGA